MRSPLHQLHENDIQASPEGHRWIDLVRSYVVDIRKTTFTWNPTSVAANTHEEQTVTISGMKVGDDILSIVKPTFTDGFLVGQGRVSAADTVEIQIANGKGDSSNPPEEVYTLIYIKNSRP